MQKDLLALLYSTALNVVAKSVLHVMFELAPKSFRESTRVPVGVAVIP